MGEFAGGRRSGGGGGFGELVQAQLLRRRLEVAHRRHDHLVHDAW